MRIRAAAERPDFKKRQYARVHNSVRNFKSAKEYVYGLFEKHSRLLVLRIDFGYTVDAAQSVTVDDAHADREKFLNNRRSNSLFASLLGYVWKLEYGEEKGHHFRFMYFTMVPKCIRMGILQTRLENTGILSFQTEGEFFTIAILAKETINAAVSGCQPF